MQDAGAGRRPTLVFVRQQVVNLDRIAEISFKRGRVTLCFAFARLGETGARLTLAPAEAEPLLTSLRQINPEQSPWVAIEDRLVNLDLVVDIWSTHDELILVPALADQRGGPLPRAFTKTAARSLMAYFEHAGSWPQQRLDHPDWVTAGEHLINLALVSGVRLGAQHVQLLFTGLPRFTRNFSYADARALIERLQQSGALPIDAIYSGALQTPDDEPELTSDDAEPGQRRRTGGWLVRRR